jgi:hypothetical protein
MFPDELPGPDYKMKLDWFYIIWFSFVHVGAVYGLIIPAESRWTILYCKFSITTEGIILINYLQHLVLETFLCLASPLELIDCSATRLTRQTCH